MLAVLVHGLYAHAQEESSPAPAPEGAEATFQPPELALLQGGKPVPVRILFAYEFTGWESVAIKESKQTVDSQVTHAAGICWRVARDLTSVTATLEVDNLTNAKAFDNYGVQRPGRAFYLKVTGEL